jgi:outer membrane protein OmpA-like peptidoglycan-associated protein
MVKQFGFIGICLALFGCTQEPAAPIVPVAATPPVAANPPVSANAPAAKIIVFPEAALFEFGQAELKPEGKEKITEYRELAKEELSRADKVMIAGYTDNVGEEDFNLALSLQRAAAVRDHLVTLGADPTKFEVSGGGETNPVADNTTDEGRAQNRRVEVAVVGVRL